MVTDPNSLYDHTVAPGGAQYDAAGNVLPGQTAPSQAPAANNGNAKQVGAEIQTGIQNAQGQINAANQNAMSAFNTIFGLNTQTQTTPRQTPSANLNVSNNLLDPNSIMNTPVVTSDRRAKTNIAPAKSDVRQFLEQISKVYNGR